MKKPGILSLVLLILTFTTACFGGIFLFKKVNKQRDYSAAVKPGYIFTSMKSHTPKDKFKEMIKLKDQALVNLLKDVRLANKQLYISTSRKKKKGAKVAFTGVLDINKASAEQFTQIKGIGKGTAENIIKFRKENGQFMSVDDLTKVKRIGKATIKKIGKYLKVDEKIAAKAKALAKESAKDSGKDSGKSVKKDKTLSKESSDTNAVVNINTANSETLVTLKGIGSSSAEGILEYRKENGPFKSIEDLTKVKGIGPSHLKKNRLRLTVGAIKPDTSTTPDTSIKSDALTKPGATSKLAEKAGVTAKEKLPKNTTIEDMSSMIMNDLGKDVKDTKDVKNAPATAEGRININTANNEQLCKLKGIGKSSAQRIIDYRKEHGPFKTIEDITKVKRIGTKTLEKFKNLISVE